MPQLVTHTCAAAPCTCCSACALLEAPSMRPPANLSPNDRCVLQAAPYSKTGGLGDVCGSLPKALAARGHRVMVVVPRYQEYEGAEYTGVRILFFFFFLKMFPSGYSYKLGCERCVSVCKVARELPSCSSSRRVCERVANAACCCEASTVQRVRDRA